MIKVKIYPNDNNNTYEEFSIQQSFNYKDRLNEQLDESLIVINLIEKHDFQPFDRCLLQFEDQSLLYWYLGKIKAESATFENNQPKLFNYTIQLISPTKMLERIILPNVAITQPINEEASNRTSIAYQLRRFRDLYASNYLIDDSLDTLLNQITCPEMVMQNPTLKEVINTLLEPVHRIVKVNQWNIISSIDLNESGKEIDTSKVTDFNYNTEESDYCNFLYSYLKNGLIANKNHILSSVHEYNLTPRANNNILTTETLQLILSKPIYKIKKIVAKLKAQYLDANNATSTRYIEIDITNRVLEKKEYDLISSLDQRFYLYYNIEENIIDGLSYHTSNSNVTYGIYGSIYKSMEDQGLITGERESYLINSIYDSDRNPPTEIMYDVEYESLDDVTLITHRGVNNRHEVGLIDNQSESYIDTDRFGLREKDTVNRLGNESLMMIYRCSGISELPELGDKYQDYRLVEMDVNVYETEVVAKLSLYKNYVMKNLYTGISSKKRSWQYAEASEACLRQENIHYNVWIGKSATTNTDYIKYFNDFISPSGNDYTVKAMTFQTKTADALTNISKEIYMPFSTRICGDSVTFNFTLMDNIEAGVKNLGHSNEFALFQSGGWNQQYVKYVDNLGRFDSVTINMYAGINPLSNFITSSLNNVSGNDNAISRKVSWRHPEYKNDDSETLDYNILADKLDMSITKRMLKDNREILGITLQFEYRSYDASKFIIGSGLADACPLINKELPLTLSVYVNNTYIDQYMYDQIIGTKVTNVNFTRSTLGIGISFTNQGTYKSYILCAMINGKEEPLIYVNQINGAVSFIPFAIEQ